MSVGEDIWAEIDKRLAAIERAQSYERMPSGDPDTFPALAGYDEGDEPTETETAVTRLNGTITVEGFVQGAGGAPAHNAMMALHADVVKALCGDDATLGGLVTSIEITGRRRVSIAVLASERRLGFAQDFKIEFATVRGDPHQHA